MSSERCALPSFEFEGAYAAEPEESAETELNIQVTTALVALGMSSVQIESTMGTGKILSLIEYFNTPGAQVIAQASA